MLKIIDAHMHFSRIEDFKKTAVEISGVDYSSAGLMKEYKDANVVIGIGMGLTEEQRWGFPDPASITPMSLNLEGSEENPPHKIVYCAGVNPYRLEKEDLTALEESLQRPEVVGIKIYLGYYPFYAYDEVYAPVYQLAMQYSLPVVFHTGDTYSEEGLLKYAHPLTLDEVAVKYRGINFVMAHLGDPWCLDGAEVVYKNRNMYADLSGLIVGDADKCLRLKNCPVYFSHLRHALVYCDSYDKFMFGTDWPLAPVAPYIEFVKDLIPEEHHEDVFYNTALKVFPKIKSFI